MSSSSAAAAAATAATFTADSLFTVPETLILTQASTRNQEQLVVSINNQELEYPAGWLRFRCQCSDCFHPNSQSFTCLLETIIYQPSTKKLGAVSLKSGGAMVECVWGDGHVSEFTARWLFIRRFTEEGLRERNETLYFPKPVAWPREPSVKQASYKQVTETDKGFMRFGEQLIRDGIFLVSDTPDRCVADEFCEKVGLPIYPTHYGKEFSVVNLPTPNNAAYTGRKLELHVDLPYLTYCPQIQYLHCLVQCDSGGENVFGDGIKAARILRERRPDLYQVLRDKKTTYEDIIALPGQTNHYLLHRKPVINEDEDGEVEFLQFSINVSSSYYDGASARDCATLQEAFEQLLKICNEECSIRLKSRPGDMLVFDNRRVLHARESFSTAEPRKLEGFYTNWDFIYSRMRVTRIRQLQSP